MDTLETQEYLTKKYSLNINGKGIATLIPDMGRSDIAGLFRELGLNKGVEIGTEHGYFAEILCKANPDLKLFCVDPWKDYENGLGYYEGTTQEQFDDIYKGAVERLHPYNVTIIREFSEEAGDHFPDNSLDFVYIDGNHRLEYVVADIAVWTKKVRPGGIVAGHDFIKYKNQCNSHVVEAVNAFNLAYRRGLPWFVVGLPKANCDFRSWFFIK